MSTRNGSGWAGWAVTFSSGDAGSTGHSLLSLDRPARDVRVSFEGLALGPDDVALKALALDSGDLDAGDFDRIVDPKT